MIQSIIEGIRAVASERGIEVWIDIAPRVPSSGRFDHKNVRIALGELLSYLLYLSSGGSVGALVYGRGPREVVVEVLQNGIGITSTDFERLSYEAKHPLNRARAAARRLGSDVVYELSHRSSGIYRFRFAVEPSTPLQTEGPHKWALCTQPPLAGRVLLIERDGQNRRLLRRLMEDLGIAVSVADSALGAIDRALFGGFDLVLMGLDTPDVNPYGTSRVLRRTGLDKPIVGLSNKSTPEIREKIDRAGFDGALIRPIDRLTLIELASRYLPKRQRNSS
ncbi:MAG: response regulator [bacterium]|nr:response regulator [bacterium]